MRNFRPTNPHGTAFPPMKCLYQMEATGMENKKCIALVRGTTPPTCADLQTTPFYGGSIRPRKE